MKRIPRAPLIGLGLLGLAVAVAVLVLGEGGATPAAAQPAGPFYKCYNIAGPAPGVPSVSIMTQFGNEKSVAIGTPSLLCLPAGVNGQPIPAVPDLKCYKISGHGGKLVNLTTQFGVESHVAVGQALELCTPAGMAISPAQPTTFDPIPHYECYTITGPPPVAPPMDLLTELGVEHGVVLQQATRLCLPAGKNSPDIPAVPHLKCYDIAGPAPGPVVNLTTQFGPEPNIPVGPPARVCVPAVKDVVPVTPVGGIAEVPGLAGTSAEEAGMPAESSGWSAGAYAALAAGLAALAVALGAGAWYARRRWPS